MIEPIQLTLYSAALIGLGAVGIWGLLKLLRLGRMLLRSMGRRLKRAFAPDPLERFEPISDEELLLLSAIDEMFYEPYMHYLRTLIMDPTLGEYLKDHEELLQSTGYFIMLRNARIEAEKKKRWEQERSEGLHKQQNSDHTSRMILQSLKRLDGNNGGE